MSLSFHFKSLSVHMHTQTLCDAHTNTFKPQIFPDVCSFSLLFGMFSPHQFQSPLMAACFSLMMSLQHVHTPVRVLCSTSGCGSGRFLSRWLTEALTYGRFLITKLPLRKLLRYLTDKADMEGNKDARCVVSGGLRLEGAQGGGSWGLVSWSCG